MIAYWFGKAYWFGNRYGEKSDKIIFKIIIRKKKKKKREK